MSAATEAVIRDAVAAAVAEPVRLADLSEAEATYLRRLGASRGLTTDEEIDAALGERPDPDAADLDAIAKRARR